MRLTQILAAGLVIVGLSGCAVPVAMTIASYAADGASFVATGRSMSDHGLSILLREDCALFRAVKGEAVCRPMQKNDLVYDIAFARRTLDFPDPDGPGRLAQPATQVAARPEPIQSEPIQSEPAPARLLAADRSPRLRSEVAGRTDRTGPGAGHLLSGARPAPVRVAALPGPQPEILPLPQPAVLSVPPPGYRVIAGAFNQREGAIVRRHQVQAQLRDLGQPDVPVFVVQMPAGSPARYVVLTRPLEEQRADILLGGLQLGQGDSAWKMRTDGPAL